MIYHMLPTQTWREQSANQPYAGDTLASEGFIHCTAEPDRLLLVANTWYRTKAGDWLILEIDEKHIHPEVRWEENHGHLFPHIYGALNLDAVRTVIPFPRLDDGTFVLPAVL